MEKYKYKCDNEACNHVFVAENPSNCPKCECDDFIIIGETGPIWPKVVFVIGLIGIIGVSTYYLWLTDDGTGTTIEINDDSEKPDGTKKSIAIEYKVIDNYIKVISPEESDFVKLNFRIVHSTEGNEIYREKNKFYPCEEADYLFKWENSVDLTLKDDNKKINDFKFNNKSPHENACEEVLEFVSININSDCRYTISTNLENNKIEVSLKENSDYIKGKVKWSYSEAGSNPTFYVRKIGSDNIKIISENCESKPLNPPSPSKVVKSFNLYKQNIDENDVQFYDVFKGHLPDIVVIKGESKKWMDFMMHLSTENDNTNGSYSKNLILSESGVVYTNNKVTKLIIN